MNRLDKCACGNTELVILVGCDHYESNSMSRKLKCTACVRLYEESWKLDSVIELVPKKYWLIEEENKINNEDAFANHFICKAVTEDDACEKWKEEYHSYTLISEADDYPKIDVGTRTIAVTSVKQITKEEYVIYAKVFEEL